MKMKIIIFIALLLILTAFFIKFSPQKSKEEFKPLTIEVGDVFDGMNYGDTMYVLNYAIGDVTSDTQNDMILLVGSKETNNHPFAQKVDVVVYDTASKQFQKAGLKSFEGTSPKIMLADVTGDAQNDVVAILTCKDGTQQMRIVETGKGTLDEIFHKKENRGIVIVGEVVDGLKAHLRCGKFQKEMNLDVSDMKNSWIQENKVNESGKILDLYPQVVTRGFESVDLVQLNHQKAVQTIQSLVTFSRK